MHIPKTGDPGRFQRNSTLPSTSDCIKGDDIIMEDICVLKAASGNDDQMIIWFIYPL